MVTLLSVVTTMATKRHNQSASRILWKLPLKSNLSLMVCFTQQGPDQLKINLQISQPLDISRPYSGGRGRWTGREAVGALAPPKKQKKKQKKNKQEEIIIK